MLNAGQACHIPFLHPSGQNYAFHMAHGTCCVQAAESPLGQAGFCAIITIYSCPILSTLLPNSFLENSSNALWCGKQRNECNRGPWNVNLLLVPFRCAVCLPLTAASQTILKCSSRSRCSGDQDGPSWQVEESVTLTQTTGLHQSRPEWLACFQHGRLF